MPEQFNSLQDQVLLNQEFPCSTINLSYAGNSILGVDYHIYELKNLICLISAATDVVSASMLLQQAVQLVLTHLIGPISIRRAIDVNMVTLENLTPTLIYLDNSSDW